MITPDLEARMLADTVPFDGEVSLAADLACHVKALLCEVERLRELTRPQSAKVVPPKAAYLPGPAPEPAAVAGAADRWGRVATGKPAADVYNSRVLNPDGKSPNEDRAVLANAYAMLLSELEDTRNQVRIALGGLDGLANLWGDEAVFRRCRDRLRMLVEPATPRGK